MIYNFRIDRSPEIKGEIIQRLENDKILSQGWGGGAGANLDLNHNNFVRDCYDYYQLNSTRIPTNLTWIREFKDQDILVIPHLPENGKVTLAVVDGDYPNCYYYDVADPSHQNHRIKIKEVYGLDGNISIYNSKLTPWYAKLQWKRLPVLKMNEFEDIFKDVTKELKNNSSHIFGVSELEDYLLGMKKDVMDQISRKLQQINPSRSKISFESICERIVTDHGYQIVRRNMYSKSGGDIDLVCVREILEESPFTQRSEPDRLYVQVKKHTGQTDIHAVNQVMDYLQKDPAVDGCVMSLADDFTPNAKQLADQQGIVLLNGEKICELLLKTLANHPL